jgi:mono/diheme cytochrome c family protein
MLPAFAVIFALSSVWDGVYTVEQASRGNAAYNTHCAVCHRSDLGGREGRPLVGKPFFDSWGEDTLGSLFAVIRERMPASKPGSLDESTYLDILAYILQRNEYPAGSAELTGSAVNSIQVVGKEGPRPVPNFSLVRIVGCLEDLGKGGWRLIRSSEPARTRDPAPSKASELGRSKDTPLGNQAFVLMDAYDEPQGLAGQKLEVKGLLMRGSPDKVNFSSLQVLAPSCAP